MTRPLTDRELELIQLYTQCRLGLSPRAFYSKWGVSYEVIAAICSRSPVTVRRWFKQGPEYRSPQASDLWHLALMDFLLEHFETMPTDLLQLLCPDLSSSEPEHPGGTSI
ncbi:helix-turn-helix domain-containing protein [Nodosilinea sp. LEGE 07298]|uniref:helix-turn-helix domain-containing protein n=1 Tax=Nodosilinea sp. LEGE 07298 TaxID=2777970 RepID=UPI0018805E6F|nr:helix-turn-helix domain-containing protein [Nodosilinea sp. LEGE 07298]MBE9108409.1 helix-turn-helix domain-containing protein [Nodosilinea sp. LEGE 07298]